MIIAHNIQAMNASRQYGITGGNLAKETERLSSGYRINRAADDAAGLSISEKLRKQIRGLTQAGTNAEDGISMMQVADGAMAEVHDMIDRGLELSVQAANGIMSESDRQSIQDEIDQLKTEIDAIREKTKFNEVYVLKGKKVATIKNVPAGVVNSGGTLPAWVNFGQAQQDGILSETYQTTNTYYPDKTNTGVTTTVTIDHAAASIDFSGLTAANVQDLIGTGFHSTCCTCNSYYSVEFVTNEASNVEVSGNHYIYKINIDNVSTGAELVDRILTGMGKMQGSDISNPNNHFTMFTADAGNKAKLWIYDDRSKKAKDDTVGADWSDTDSEWVDWKNKNYEVQSTPAGSMGLFGEGVMREQTAQVVTGYHDVYEQLALQIGAETGERMAVELPVISSKELGIDTADVRTQDGADASITAFHEAKAIVSKHRSRMGAYQNRLEHTVKNLDNVVENTTASESQIRDADMAEEMVAASKDRILQQAGQSVLAQANQINQGVLSLIAS